MDRDAIFEGLNAEQRRAVEHVRGPVCILAGAGSGKTTTITRRVANQVATGAFAPGEILAVTFTDKAAGEMRERLGALGVRGVAARTFHSAALAQLHHFRPGGVGEVLSSKAILLTNIARTLPGAYRFRAVIDLATEIEWAKNRRLTPENYRDGLGAHEPPLPADLMLRVFREYEGRKARAGRIDFEDLLELAIRLYDEDEAAAATFRERYRAFTVDEYQDVNLLQQTLLDRWLGDRDEVCVVGDDYQSIYSFTGATAQHLLGMPTCFPGTLVVRLEENHRSTPEILALANRLVPELGGSEKVLRAVRPSGTEPIVRSFAGSASEIDFVVEEARRFHEAGAVPWEEIAILYRINSDSEDYEEAFSHAGIPFQVRGGAFLARPGARGALRLLRRAVSEPAAEAVRRAVEAQGLVERIPDGVGEEEATRQNDLARLLRLAEEFAGTVAEFVVDLEARFGSEAAGRGVNLLTYHRAKGLEFEVVFLPGLEEGRLPFKRAKTDEARAEERRLLYVGMTRAKSRLFVTWSATGKPSRFLRELGAATTKRELPPLEADAVATFEALKRWRLVQASEEGVRAFMVFGNRTLEEIACRFPQTLDELAEVSGVGPAKLARYGEDVLRTLAALPAEPVGARLASPALSPDPVGARHASPADGVFETLRTWRRERAQADGVPAYVVFHDATLERIAGREPRTLDDLAEIEGVGPAKLERYGEDVLAAVSAA